MAKGAARMNLRGKKVGSLRMLQSIVGKFPTRQVILLVVRVRRHQMGVRRRLMQFRGPLVAFALKRH